MRARDMNRFRALSQERAEIDPVVTRFREHERTQSDLLSAQEMLSDPDMKHFAEEEIGAAKARLVDLEADLERLLLPKDPNDERNVFLEVRAGTGGDESALFAGDLLRMYLRFAERQRWQTEMISSSDSDLGGYKEAIVRIIGAGAYSKLKFESGGHRVQRVPETEAQGPHPHLGLHRGGPGRGRRDRRREDRPEPRSASTCIARAEPAASTSTRPSRRCASRTCRPASWSSARTTARSTRTRNARSRSSPRASRTSRCSEQQTKEASTRKSLIGSGDRSERIRTYNFPQGRVTDHRINLTLYKIDQIMDGDINELVSALAAEFQAEQLAALGEAA